jgi:undecaprenyl diphosphate synthase
MTKIPKHVSIIMDGNGRWAKNRGLDRVEGHKSGVESVRAAVEFAVEKGVEYLSFFAFSEENWKRPQEEVYTLMGLMVQAIINEIPAFNKNNIRFRVIGDIERLPENLKEKIYEAEKGTENNSALTVIIFLSYSGKWDIVQAAKKYHQFLSENIQLEPKLSAIEIFESFLSTKNVPDPDLLIRTSGEQRISNFMLWQCAYSEFYFSNVLWPDFRKTDFQAALDAYSSRERRFGQTEEQINKKS